MKLVMAYFRAKALQLIRLPAYSVMTIAFPAVLFLFFGVLIFSGDSQKSNIVMASFAAYAIFSVMVYQFGVDIAMDRASPWDTFLRTLAVPIQVRFLAQLLSALVFAIATAGLVILIAAVLTPISISAVGWLRLIIALLLGSIPFGLLGIALGYLLNEKVVLPVANLTLFFLGFMGGFFMPVSMLPDIINRISPVFPTRPYGELVWASVLNMPWKAWWWLELLAYTLVFGLLAWWAFRRGQLRQYH